MCKKPHDIPTTCLRVLASLYEFCTVTRQSLRFSMIYYDMLRYFYKISTTTYDSRSTFHDFYTTSDAFKNKKVYMRF